MGRWFRDKKSAGCAMCKYWKHGWGIKFKEKELAFRKRTDRLIMESTRLDEEIALKATDGKTFGGSSPSLSAEEGRV